MAGLAPPQGRWVIVMTFVVALLLTAMPLPEWLSYARPEWVALTLVYWCMALPQRVGVGAAWFLGLLLDVLRGAALGQHAMALSLVAFLALKLHQQIRVYPMWQQALSVMGFMTLYALLVLWISGFLEVRTSHWYQWLPVVTSALIWPWLFIILRDVRRHFGVR